MYRLILLYCGEDAVKHFIAELLRVKKEFAKNQVDAMALKPEEERSFQEATHCSICKRPTDQKHVKDQDHDHITSICRGAAHVYCKLSFKQAKIIPVVFHNLKHFDTHHILSKREKCKDFHITFCLKEKKYYNLQYAFIGSLQFLPSFLHKLTSYIDSEVTISKIFMFFIDMECFKEIKIRYGRDLEIMLVELK